MEGAGKGEVKTWQAVQTLRAAGQARLPILLVDDDGVKDEAKSEGRPVNRGAESKSAGQRQVVTLFSRERDAKKEKGDE